MSQQPIRNMSIDRNAAADSKKAQVSLNQEDRLALGHMKFAQGMGASIRYASELRAVQQPSRMAPNFLRSSNLHEDVLRGNLGAGSDLGKNILWFGSSDEQQ